MPRSYRAKPTGSKLNPMQMLFVGYFFESLNCTQAAIAAGYSKKTAHVQGSQLLTHPEIRRELARRFDEQAKLCSVRKEHAVYGLHRIAMHWEAPLETQRRAWRDIAHIMGWTKFTISLEHNEGGVPRHEDPELRALIRSLPPDKLRAFEDAMEYLVKMKAERMIEGRAEPAPILEAPIKAEEPADG